MNDSEKLPTFEFEPPRGYRWIVERGWVGFTPSSGLQPWYYLDKAGVFRVSQRWPKGASNAELVAFARRQDNDDIACFEIGDAGPGAVVLIHGWTSSGYDIVARYPNFWEWLKAVVDEVAEWSEMGE